MTATEIIFATYTEKSIMNRYEVDLKWDTLINNRFQYLSRTNNVLDREATRQKADEDDTGPSFNIVICSIPVRLLGFGMMHFKAHSTLSTERNHSTRCDD